MIAAAAWHTPLGSEVELVVDRLQAGHRELQLAAPPPPSRQARFLDRLGLFALDAGLRAAAGASLPAGDRLGVFAATGGLRPCWDDLCPALAGQRADGQDAWARGLSKLHPFLLLKHLSNNVHALLAAELGARGEGACFGGRTAGAQALAAANRALDDGAIDAAIVVAADSLLGQGGAEAAAALVLSAVGTSSVQAATGAAGSDRLAFGAHRGEPEVAAFGELGAAAALVHAIAWTSLLPRVKLRGAAAVIAGGACVRVELR